MNCTFSLTINHPLPEDMTLGNSFVQGLRDGLLPCGLQLPGLPTDRMPSPIDIAVTIKASHVVIDAMGAEAALTAGTSIGFLCCGAPCSLIEIVGKAVFLVVAVPFYLIASIFAIFKGLCSEEKDFRPCLRYLGAALGSLIGIVYNPLVSITFLVLNLITCSRATTAAPEERPNGTKCPSMTHFFPMDTVDLITGRELTSVAVGRAYHAISNETANRFFSPVALNRASQQHGIEIGEELVNHQKNALIQAVFPGYNPRTGLVEARV